MNSYERVHAVFENRTPDRVPVAEMFIDPAVIESICPGMSGEDFVEYADLDIVTCLTMIADPETTEWVDEEKQIWRDKWGALQELEGNVIPVCLPPARIETEEDLDAYTPPDPLAAPVIRQARKLVDRFKGRKAIAVVGESAFAPSQYLRAGLANLMMDYALRPEFVKKLAMIGTEYHVELFRKLIAEGVEIIFLGDDFAGKSGTMMSPAHFEQYILPAEKTVIAAIHEAGGYAVQHTDGNILGILDLLLESGTDAFGPIEHHYMDMREVRRRSNGRAVVMGSLPIDLLSRGTVDEVKAETRRQLEQMAPHGGHIISSANTIPTSVRGENFLAMIETATSFRIGAA